MHFASAHGLYMLEPTFLKVELIYAPLQQDVLHMSLRLPIIATVAEALSISGLAQLHPEISEASLGIFSKPVTLDTYLNPGDRIEIYRPLLCDPKEIRRRRAAKKL